LVKQVWIMMDFVDRAKGFYRTLPGTGRNSEPVMVPKALPFRVSRKFGALSGAGVFYYGAG
jgi:hypothetical protein